MPLADINKICVIGGGVMGLQIALVAAVHGYRATVYDTSTEALQKAPDVQRDMLRTMQFGQSLITGYREDDTLSRINYTDDAVAAAAGADITSESVPERIEIKQATHARFEQLVKPGCIMTTNTSTLRVSDIDRVLQRPEKFCAMHFHSGLTPLVDIMRGRKTDETTVQKINAFIIDVGLVPMIMRKEKAGYLHNSLLTAQMIEALSLVAEGYAGYQEVDRAWMLVTGQNHGPFAVVDSIGLNVVNDMLFNPETLKYYNFEKIQQLLKPYVEQGHLGIKTGKGFYNYPNPQFAEAGFLKGNLS